jgi:GLPGLI family protein
MKILKSYILKCILLLSSSGVAAQSTDIIHQGEIEFEKRVNSYAILNEYYSDDRAKQFATQYKSSKPQFGVTTYALLFNNEHSLYSPTEATVNMSNAPLLTKLNIAYSDLIKQTSISRKNILSEEFLVSDSLRKIEWKLTDETKEIAGFTCRRANAIIMDSIYVVAFYSDQIVPKGGPESFTGLPGMILGVALPHYHITWFATRVLNREVAAKEIKPPTAKKTITNKDLWNLYTESPTFKSNAKIARLNWSHSMF